MPATIPSQPESVMSTAVSAKSHPKPAQVLKDTDFNWEDPLGLEADLTEEERMVRDSARAFSQDKLMPRVRLAWREERVDKELLPEMGALGLLGPTIPEEYGGGGGGGPPPRPLVPRLGGAGLPRFPAPA